jgi:aminopeptidase N
LRPHRNAIGRYSLEDGKLVRVGRHELDVNGARTEVPELVGLPQPNVLLPNDDDLTYAKLRFDDRSYATLLDHTADFAESLPRSLVIGAFWEMVREGAMPARDFVDLLLASLATETHSTVIRTILQTTKQIPSQLLTSATLFCAPEHREETQAKVAEALRKMAEDAEPGSDRQLQLVGAFARAARSADDVARLRAAFDGNQPYPGLELDQDLRWSLLSALAALGDATDEEIAGELARDDTNAGREKAFHARAARPTVEAKAEAWRLAVEEDGQPNAVIEALSSGWNRALDQSLLESYVPRFFDALLPVWNGRSAAIRERIIGKEYPLAFYPLGLASPELVEATESWLAANEGAPHALRRLVLEKLDAARTAVVAQQCDAKRG